MVIYYHFEKFQILQMSITLNCQNNFFHMATRYNLDFPWHPMTRCTFDVLTWCYLLALSQLYARYPNLHVFSYGTLPCVDSVIAEACSDFVTRFENLYFALFGLIFDYYFWQSILFYESCSRDFGNMNIWYMLSCWFALVFFDI